MACGSPPKTVLGRWELKDATNLLGTQGNPSDMEFKLLLARTQGDSVFGRAYAAFGPGPHDDRVCGVVKGERNGRAGVYLTVFTEDDPGMDIILEGRFRGDSLLVQTARPRSGKDHVPWGAWLVFLRTSDDTISGCLTRA